MSVVLKHIAAAARGLSKAELHVLTELASRAEAAGGHDAVASSRELAVETGLARASVQAAIHKLNRSGLIYSDLGAATRSAMHRLLFLDAVEIRAGNPTAMPRVAQSLSQFPEPEIIGSSLSSMPSQETFFEQQIGSRKIQILKSYDQSYAREAFAGMDDEALRHLWQALKPEEIYDPGGLPSLDDPDGEAEAFLWDEMLDQAREPDNALSFFIVNEIMGSRVETRYVSPDWPSAEKYAKGRLESSALT